MSSLDAETTIDDSAQTDYKRIGIVSAGHFTNDLCGNLMTSLTPYLVVRGEITLTAAGMVTLIYLIGSSILQPAFGMLSDRTGRRYFVVLAPFWIAVAAGLFGWATNSLELLLLAALGGIATAAFHPQAASMVTALSSRSKGWAMSIFSMGGNVGFSFGPIAAAAVAGAGLHWSLLVIIPGVLLSVLLAHYAPHPARSRANPAPKSLRSIGSGRWRPISLIVGVIAIRSGAHLSLMILLPLYFHAQGYATQLGSYYAFILTASGALGGLVGGPLSDTYGRKRIVVGSLVFAAPLLFLALIAPVPLVWPLIGLGGAALLASNSVTVVQSQELLPLHTGIAAGLTMGLGFGLSGVITSALAFVSDHIGVHAAVFAVPLLTLMAATVALLVSDNRPHLAAQQGAAAHLGVPGAS